MSKLLPSFIEKQLLQDIEDSIIPRVSIKASDIINLKQDIYGLSGSEERRKIQSRLKNIKSLSAQKYENLLRKHNVVSRGTRYTVNTPESLPSPTTTPVATASPSPTITPVATSSQSHSLTAESPESSTIMEDDMSPMKYSRENALSPPLSTPSRNLGRASTTSRSTPSRTTTPIQEYLSSAQKTAGRNIEQAMNDLTLDANPVTSRHEDGTAEHPFKIVVNTEHPERNREFFILSDIQGMEKNNVLFTGVEVRKVVEAGNVDDWSAQVLLDERIPTEYLGRIVQIKGPAMSSKEKMHESFNDKNFEDNLYCLSTHNTDAKVLQEFEEDEKRHFVHYYLIFPESHVLDNFASAEGMDEAPPLVVDVSEQDGQDTFIGFIARWRFAISSSKRKMQVRRQRTSKFMARNNP